MKSAFNQIKQLGQTEHTTILQKVNGFIEIETSGVYIAEAIHYRAIQLGLMSEWNHTNVKVYIWKGANHANVYKFLEKKRKEIKRNEVLMEDGE